LLVNFFGEIRIWRAISKIVIMQFIANIGDIGRVQLYEFERQRTGNMNTLEYPSVGSGKVCCQVFSLI